MTSCFSTWREKESEPGLPVPCQRAAGFCLYASSSGRFLGKVPFIHIKDVSGFPVYLILQQLAECAKTRIHDGLPKAQASGLAALPSIGYANPFPFDWDGSAASQASSAIYGKPSWIPAYCLRNLHRILAQSNPSPALILQLLQPELHNSPAFGSRMRIPSVRMVLSWLFVVQDSFCPSPLKFWNPSFRKKCNEKAKCK